MIIALQILVCLILISFGAFFSGSETGVYRLSRFKLRIGVEDKRTFYRTLSSLMGDSHGLVLSILVGNNLANYIVTSTVTIILLETSPAGKAELLTTLVMTPMLFIFSEVVPKNVYYHRSDKLMPALAPVLWLFHKLFTFSGLVGLLKLISILFTRLIGSSTDPAAAVALTRKNKIERIIRETRDEGILSAVQRDMMNRVVKIPNISIGSVMTPVSKAIILDLDTDSKQLREVLAKYPYSRYPVRKTNTNRFLGYIDIYRTLASGKDFRTLEEFITPIPHLRTTTSVIDAMNSMRKRSHKIVLVTPNYSNRSRKKAKIAGILTMKDLVEELTGELGQW